MQWQAAKQSMLEVSSHMKGTVFTSFGQGPTGFASHEVGTVRMGKDPRTSVSTAIARHGCKKSFRHRRQLLYHLQREESDADHHGPVIARGRLYKGATKKRRALACCGGYGRESTCARKSFRNKYLPPR